MIVKSVRQALVLAGGGIVLTLGVIGIVLPLLPAVVLIPAGLAILATEFVWAARLLKHVRKRIEEMTSRKKKGKPANSQDAKDGLDPPAEPERRPGQVSV